MGRVLYIGVCIYIVSMATPLLSVLLTFRIFYTRNFLGGEMQFFEKAVLLIIEVSVGAYNKAVLKMFFVRI